MASCVECLHYNVCYKKPIRNVDTELVMIGGCSDYKPTADVEEVKHGTWVKEKEYEDGKIDYKCSVCDYDDTFTETTIVFHKYCNYCGAKMDGTPKERGGEK